MKSGLVSFIGRPNAGKSTLINRVVGTKIAIVSDRPQTTRTRILGVKNYANAQAVFLDTPGIHRPMHRMNVRMVDRAIETIREVDVLCVVIDVADPPGRGERFVLDLVRETSAPVFLLLNKIDLIRKSTLLPIIDRYRQQGSFAEIVPISAATGENVDRFEQTLIERLPESEALYPENYVTDQGSRARMAEIVREKLLQFTHAEIPFASAVVVDALEEPAGPNDVLKLYCSIVVERESQKRIVVGKGGAMIKRIGSVARPELERVWSARVYLDLRVIVKADWRESERVLAELGLGDGG